MSERKYRQRGYQDDERPRGGERRGPRPERPEGPRGRGLGAPSHTVMRCARCGAQRPPSDPILADTVCADCGSDLHTCTNCRHFDTAALNECRLEVAERIAKKASRNRCEEFEPKTTRETGGESARGDDPKSQFDALFDF